MYRKRVGAASIIEVTFVVLVASILAVSTLHIKNVVCVSRDQNLIDYIEKQDSMWRETKDMGYGPITGRPNIAYLRYDISCKEVGSDDPTAVVIFHTRDHNDRMLGRHWENYPINCLYSILGLVPGDIGIKVGKSLDVLTVNEAFQTLNWDWGGIRKKNIWIAESELSPAGINGFEMFANALKSNMQSSSDADDVLDAYFFDNEMTSDKQQMQIVTGLAADSEIVRSCNGSCKARTDISGKLIHSIEIKGKDSIVSRRYAHCSYNDNGCAMPKSAFTGLTVNTGIGPIENMTGSSCGNRKSAKNECILVTRRMQEFAPWEDWNTIENRADPTT